MSKPDALLEVNAENPVQGRASADHLLEGTPSSEGSLEVFG
jgi:hypothetical protein